MQIRIERTRSLSKRGLLSRKSWEFGCNISVDLSEAEKELVARYFDPDIGTSCVSDPSHIRFYYDGTDQGYKQIKVETDKTCLSGFALTASVKGHEYLEELEKFEAAATKALESAFRHLQILDGWRGETTLSL